MALMVGVGAKRQCCPNLCRWLIGGMCLRVTCHAYKLLELEGNWISRRERAWYHVANELHVMLGNPVTLCIFPFVPGNSKTLPDADKDLNVERILHCCAPAVVIIGDSEVLKQYLTDPDLSKR